MSLIQYKTTCKSHIHINAVSNSTGATIIHQMAGSVPHARNVQTVACLYVCGYHSKLQNVHAKLIACI